MNVKDLLIAIAELEVTIAKVKAEVVKLDSKSTAQVAPTSGGGPGDGGNV